MRGRTFAETPSLPSEYLEPPRGWPKGSCAANLGKKSAGSTDRSGPSSVDALSTTSWATQTNNILVSTDILRCAFELVNGWTPLIRSSLSGHRRQRSARLVRPWGNAQQPAVLRPRHGTLLSGSAGVGAWGGAWRVAIATAFRPLVVTIGAHDRADTAVLLQHRARPRSSTDLTEHKRKHRTSTGTGTVP